jgi:hypothetical protein
MPFSKGHNKLGGRKKGSLNKRTRLAQQIALDILTDKKYLKGLRARMIDAQPSPEIEKMIWRYGFGEPLNPNLLLTGPSAALPPKEDAKSDSE